MAHTSATNLKTISPYQHALFWSFVSVLILGFVWLFKAALLPFVLGIAIAYLLDPAMEKLTDWKLPRWASAAIILAVFFILAGLALALIAPVLYREIVHLIDIAPKVLDKIWGVITPYTNLIESHFGEGTVSDFRTLLQDNIGKTLAVSQTIITHLVSGGQAFGQAIANTLTLLIITPIVSFFMLVEWKRMTAWVDDLCPRGNHQTVRNLLEDINNKVSGFVRGQITIAFFLGVIYAIALTVLDLNFGFLIGMTAGLLSIIPLVGSTIGLIISVGVAWFQSQTLGYTAIIALVFMVGQFIEGNILTPKFLGKSVGLHPLWILFAIMAGGSVLGILGMFLAVPVAATIGVLIGFAISQYKLSDYYVAPATANSKKKSTAKKTAPKKKAASKSKTSKAKSGKAKK